ncbi:MAG: CopD family protein [Proteobacteria bacterium]|nr:CopD family protein [Pseudomonadota bacterium]
MLWLKALHVSFVVTWFAGLFYLPRLFVYHADCRDAPGLERFVVMERRLFFIMSLGALLAMLFGLSMIVQAPQYLGLGWMRAKLLLVALLFAYHYGCWRLMLALRAGRARPARWYRIYNEVPALLLLAIVILAVVKPGD